MNIRVLGVDPGTAVTGFAVVEPTGGLPGHLVECGVIRTNPKQQVCARLHTVYDGLNKIIVRHQPSVMAVENIFYGKNVRTTVALGQVRGVILLAAAQAGIDVAEFAPATVKKSVVGEGGAVKAQVGYMVQELLRLKEPPSPTDAADACAVALTYLFRARVKV